MKLILSTFFAVLVFVLVVVSILAQNAINNEKEQAPSTISTSQEQQKNFQ